MVSSVLFMPWPAVRYHAAFVAFCSILQQCCGHWSPEALLASSIPDKCMCCSICYLCFPPLSHLALV